SLRVFTANRIKQFNQSETAKRCAARSENGQFTHLTLIGRDRSSLPVIGRNEVEQSHESLCSEAEVILQ
ncbi:hypothetical protein M9458_032271, partial [Cirrhinus mrigala]